MKRFVLDVALDNGDMQTPGEVAALLRVLANRLDVYAGGPWDYWANSSDGSTGALGKDINGNTVGYWRLVVEARNKRAHAQEAQS